VTANLRFSSPAIMPATRGYSHVVEVTGPGRTVYIAGQLGLDLRGKFAGHPGDFRAQAVQCFENLKAALASVGAGFEHVVKVTSYFVDMAHLAVYFEVRDKYVNTKAPPASTAVQISRLAREGALFEIEAIAVLPEKRARAGSRSARKKTAKPRRSARKSVRRPATRRK
jgi:enamine deaminase RidA (YjgF/YER057c/UK114 family)